MAVDVSLLSLQEGGDVPSASLDHLHGRFSGGRQIRTTCDTDKKLHMLNTFLLLLTKQRTHFSDALPLTQY